MTIDTIEKALAENANAVKAALEKQAGTIESINARLREIEQKGTALSPGDGGSNTANTPGYIATKSLQTDPSMGAAIVAAQRNQKIAQVNARTSVDLSIKSILVNLGNGASSGVGEYPTRSDRNPTIATPGLRSLRLLEVMPRRPAGSDSFEFVHLSATGEASEQVHEGDEKAELDFEGDLRTGNIATIAAWTSASRQVLADNGALSSAIDTLMQHKVLSRLEHRLINGTGGVGRIDGLISLGTVMTPTIAGSPADIIGESMVRQANSGYVPNLVLLNPLDWFRIQITKSNTEGLYIFGSPTMPVPPALWNASIVASPSVPEGTGLTIDTRFTTVLDREQMSVMVTNAHKDYFTRNLVAILGELRAGLEVLDANAVYHFGIDTSSGP